MKKRLRYRLEAAALWIVFLTSSRLSPERASAIGGWIGRTVGPRLGGSRKALANIRNALPDLSETECRKAVREMWDNLGRVMMEYPHLRTIARDRTVIADRENIERARDDGKCGVIISAHLANWEIAGPVSYIHFGLELDLVYRPPNNPFADRLLARCRAVSPHLRTMPKSAQGARDIIRNLKEGRHVGILIDQKYNEGIPAMFFGVPAMTSPAFGLLAQRFKCPMVLARIERLPRCHFRIETVEIACFDEKGAPRPPEDIVAETHRHLEGWIRARPGQWLWLHRRWSSKAVALYQERHDKLHASL